eukprot:TRINITY_DN11697_c0_g1_i1.p1 TRINITY_DN11697_c0_g1~~TRINITY_DN11697_c0_g1_i1.p1  ORF type:complete len:102 (+),score=7.19 TRINITY_DN11697_c0_g1_i1:87-392(+)
MRWMSFRFRCRSSTSEVGVSWRCLIGSWNSCIIVCVYGKLYKPYISMDAVTTIFVNWLVYNNLPTDLVQLDDLPDWFVWYRRLPKEDLGSKEEDHARWSRR